MKRNPQLLLIVAALAVASIASARPPAAPSLQPTLEATGWWHELADPITVTLNIRNTGLESVALLRWQTAVDGVEADIFSVERDGVPVAYTGMLAKRPAPMPEDYIEIRPGDALSTTFDLSASYDMVVRGQYTIRYRAILEGEGAAGMQGTAGLGRVVGRQNPRPLGTVESNAIEMWVEGLDETNDTFSSQLIVGALKKPGGGGGGTGQFTNCTNTQQATILTALANATTITGKAASHLSANPGGSTLYTTWFGAYSSSRFNTVESHYDAILNAFQTKPMTFDCSCRQRYYAYVYPTQHYKVYLCRVFWTAPDLGIDSKAGTLVHETSHFNVVAGTDDYVYGTSGAKSLAISDPAKAINNADNHEYFAESQP